MVAVLPQSVLGGPKARAKEIIFSRLGYSPSPVQGEAHFHPARLKLIAGGERGGKSLWASRELVGDFPYGMLYWLVGADYEQCRPEFGYILDDLTKLGGLTDVSFPKDGSLRLVLRTGAVILTKSAKEPEKIGRDAPDGILICEAGQLSYEAFLRVRGRIAEKRGWLGISGSFESSLGWFPELYTRWQLDNPDDARSFSLPSWDNRVVYPGGRNDPEILALERIYPADRFLERFGGVPCAPAGLVMKEFRVTLHCGEYAFYPSEPVYLWIDPGYAGAYAVEVAQVKADTVYIVDEIYEQGLTTEEVIQVCKVKPWWSQVAGGAIDIAGRQHQAMPSAEEVWRVKGKVVLNSQKVGIIDGIDRLRTFLKPNPITGQPHFFVNHKCQGLIAEMGGGPPPFPGGGMWRYKTAREGGIFSELPEDKNNHACLTGDTLIDTPGGRIRIVELVGKELYVYCWIDGQLAVRKAYNIHKTRENVALVCVAMDKGNLYCTPDHLILRANGSYVEAGRLKPNASLMALNRYVIGPEGYTNLAITGQTKRYQKEHRLVYEEVIGPIPENCHIHHKDGWVWNNNPSNLLMVTMEEHASLHHKGKVIPIREREVSRIRSKKMWATDNGTLRALAQANIIIAHEANRGREPTEETKVKLSIASREAWASPELREAASMRRKGIKRSDEDRWKISEGRTEAWLRQKEAGYMLPRDAQGRFVASNHRVIGVYSAGFADVYDMTVEDAHNFVANGVFVHNSKACIYGLMDRFGLVSGRNTQAGIQKFY